jgi:hypothetical protein
MTRSDAKLHESKGPARLLVAQVHEHFQDFATGREHSPTAPLVVLHRQQEFLLGRRVIAFTRRLISDNYFSRPAIIRIPGP